MTLGLMLGAVLAVTFIMVVDAKIAGDPNPIRCSLLIGWCSLVGGLIDLALG